MLGAAGKSEQPAHTQPTSALHVAVQCRYLPYMQAAPTSAELNSMTPSATLQAMVQHKQQKPLHLSSVATSLDGSTLGHVSNTPIMQPPMLDVSKLPFQAACLRLPCCMYCADAAQHKCSQYYCDYALGNMATALLAHSHSSITNCHQD
jgi:hypothetical protein